MKPAVLGLMLLLTATLPCMAEARSDVSFPELIIDNLGRNINDPYTFELTEPGRFEACEIESGRCTTYTEQNAYDCSTHMILDEGFYALQEAILADANGQARATFLDGCYQAAYEKQAGYILICLDTDEDGGDEVCGAVRRDPPE